MKKMYKLKTPKATAQRFSKSGSGKMMRANGRESHLLRKKSKRAKRMFS